jgi:hypothetical protein
MNRAANATFHELRFRAIFARRLPLGGYDMLKSSHISMKLLGIIALCLAGSGRLAAQTLLPAVPGANAPAAAFNPQAPMPLQSGAGKSGPVPLPAAVGKGPAPLPVAAGKGPAPLPPTNGN